MDELDKSILRLYDQGVSIKKAALQLRVSQVKVKKVLANAGIAPTERAMQIQSMARNGMSVDEIAKTLEIRPKTVRNYLPYARGPKNADYPSKNALRIRACRARKLQNIKKAEEQEEN